MCPARPKSPPGEKKRRKNHVAHSPEPLSSGARGTLLSSRWTPPTRPHPPTPQWGMAVPSTQVPLAAGWPGRAGRTVRVLNRAERGRMGGGLSPLTRSHSLTHPPNAARPPFSRARQHAWTSSEEERFFTGLAAWSAARRAAASQHSGGGSAPAGFAALEPASVRPMAEALARHVRTKDASQVRGVDEGERSGEARARDAGISSCQSPPSFSKKQPHCATPSAFPFPLL